MKKIWWILIAVLVLAIGGAIWWSMTNRDQEMPATTASNPASSSTESKDTTWQVGGFAIKGNYADADLVKLADSSYRMYYSIEPEVPGNKLEMYSATSTDGVTWTQEAGTRKTMATFPDVVTLPDKTFRLYFQNAGVIKSATSTDGLKWTDEVGTRIDATNDLNLIFDNVAAETVLPLSDGTYLMVYRGTINTVYSNETPNKNTQLLLWATSVDGLSWTKKGIAIDSRNSTLEGLTDGPELFNLDGKIQLSFWSYSGVYWTTYKDSSFSTDYKNVYQGENVNPMAKYPPNPPGDPAYATFGSKMFMYYGAHQEGIKYATRSL